MINKKIRFWILIFVLFSLLLINNAQAVSIGASPATLHFDVTKSADYTEGKVLVSTSGENVSVSVSAEGEIADWFAFEKEFIVSSGKPYKLNIILKPKIDMESTRSYTGILRFTASKTSQAKQPTQVNQTNQTGIENKVKSSTTAGVVVKLIARAISCEATLKKILNQKNTILEINVINTGSAEFKPTIAVDVWDNKIENIIRRAKIQGGELLPSSEKEFSIDLKELKGEYWANIKIKECGISELVKLEKISPSTIKGASDFLTSKAIKGLYRIKIKDVLAISIYSLIIIFIILLTYRIIKDRKKDRRG